MNYTSINIQGSILSHEIIDKIQNDGSFKHQNPDAFGFSDRGELRDRIGLAWSEARTMWQVFKNKAEKLPDNETGASITRKFWIIPLLYELGYDVENARAENVNGKSYNITHRDFKLDGFPLIIMGVNEKLDKKPETGTLRMSPHALMQEYLNYTEHLYGLISDGKSLRVLRDSNRLSHLAYLEFDLEKIMEESLYNEFALMYRILHSTRMPQKQDEIENAIIEEYHQIALDSGARIRDDLRVAVKQAMEIFARGFLNHPSNDDFVEQVKNGEIDAGTFYHLMLRVVYRIIFLATTEERNLVFEKLEKNDPKRDRKLKLREIYGYYSIERLRKLCQSSIYIDPGKNDLWQGLIATFQLFEPLGYGKELGIQPLGGKLFGNESLKENGIDLESLKMNNRHFLDAFKKLTLFRDERNVLTRINYRDLDVEELGSVYEALLDLNPYFQTEGSIPVFAFGEGTERKSTGSYYTRHDLVAQLIKSALMPVMEERIKAAGKNPKKQEEALLSMNVCDPAAGSGHFLLAAARNMGFELAKIRSGEENPGEGYVLEATRDVISHCIYGVDKNPAAVELCQLSLWLVGHNSGKPLNFLDHKIKCGDSLIGVDDMQRLKKGIPDDAYKPLQSDHKKTAQYFKKENKNFKKTKQMNLFVQNSQLEDNQRQFAQRYLEIDRLQEDDVKGVEEKEKRFRKLKYDPAWARDYTACNLFTYAFFQPYQDGQPETKTVLSQNIAGLIQSGGSRNAQLEGIANARAEELKFFHWPLEFPDVYERGGFDVLIGNPPWEKIKLQEKEFFSNRDEEIANAPNKAKRNKLIRQLEESNPGLYQEYLQALNYAEATGKFIRNSERFPLTSSGDINTYSIFSELSKNRQNLNGRSGIVVPTGIATDDTNKKFFGELVEENRLVSLFDFENRKALFPNVHRSYKFCLLTTSGQALPKGYESQFAFFLHDVLDLLDKDRVFTLSREDFLNINPNTKTCPIFRTRQDAELTKKIYSYVPVLINEEKNQNPWGISFMRMFDMSNDSDKFRTEEELKREGFELKGNRFMNDEGEVWLPLYESKMIWHYDHRFGSYEGVESRSSTHIKHPTEREYRDPEYIIKPWYWVDLENVQVLNNSSWFVGFRDITNNTNERTGIFSCLPDAGVGNNLPLAISEKYSFEMIFFLSTFSSIVVDFFTRQKISGTHMNFFYVKQLAVLPPDLTKNNVDVLCKSFELLYTSWDIKAMMDDIWKNVKQNTREDILSQWIDNKNNTDGYEWYLPIWHEAFPEIHWQSPLAHHDIENNELSEELKQELIEYDAGCPLPPFKWDEGRREILRTELDAYYALLYGLERDELRYILDPKEVHGEDFPGESFRVLKNKEIRQYGEFRTRRLILEAYDRLRQDWDMEDHRKKLKEVWEKYQEDLSDKKEKPKQKKKESTQELEEFKNKYGQGKIDF